jgi:excinuclease ABC subunit A
MREELGRYQSERPAPPAWAIRLKPEALSVKIGGQARSANAPPVDPQARDGSRPLPKKLTEKQNEIARAHPEGDP